QLLPVVVAEEKPVPAPGNVARHPAVPLDLNAHVRRPPKTRDVPYGDRTRVVQPGRDDADRRFQTMHSRPEETEVGERRHDADGAVSTHAEVADVVEEDHAGRTAGLRWRAKQRAH